MNNFDCFKEKHTFILFIWLQQPPVRVRQISPACTTEPRIPAAWKEWIAFLNSLRACTDRHLKKDKYHFRSITHNRQTRAPIHICNRFFVVVNPRKWMVQKRSETLQPLTSLSLLHNAQNHDSRTWTEGSWWAQWRWWAAPTGEVD